MKESPTKTGGIKSARYCCLLCFPSRGSYQCMRWC